MKKSIESLKNSFIRGCSKSRRLLIMQQVMKYIRSPNLAFTLEVRRSCRFCLHSAPPSSGSRNLLGAENPTF